jgi:hypothetical protein
MAASAGIQFQREDDIRGLHRIIESTGGGVAMLDYDGDGRLDLFFTNGCRLPLKEQTGQTVNELYRQTATWKFRGVGALAGLSASGYFQGCAVGDFDNDGFDDLYVASFRGNRLYRNQGDGTFEDLTQATNTAVGVWSTSAAWADVNGDGHLDLYVATYLKTSDDPPELCPEPASPDGYQQCPPTMFHAEDDVLFLSDGAGGFENVGPEAGITGVDGKGLGVVIFDVDGDHRPDVFVANDGTANFLYMNRISEATAASNAPVAPAGVTPTFSDEAALRGAATDEQGVAQACMGIAHGDADGDGWIDLFVTNFLAETNTFYRNADGAGFVDLSRASGLGPPSRPYLAFGTEFLDVDNNGWLDLFIANGHVDDQRWHPARPPYAMRPQFFRNNGGGRFVEVSQWSSDYFHQEWLGRGVAVGDLDGDGDLDLAVSHQMAPSELLRNDTQTTNTSIVLRLIGGPASNRSAIHARVEASGGAFPLVREIVGGGSYQSASDRKIHLGCGSLKTFQQISIRWPSGMTQTVNNMAPGVYTVREGDNVLWRKIQ